MSEIDIVAHRPVARRRQRDRRLYKGTLLGSGPQTTEEWCFLCSLLSNSWTATAERCFLCGPCRDVISRTISENAVQGSDELFGGLVTELEVNRELLLLQDGRRGTGTVREPRVRGNVRRWKPLRNNDWWRHSRLRKLNTCCSELLSVWFSDIVIATCNYDL
jgi:hypothetical protein